MGKLMVLLILLFTQRLLSQSDTINAYDSDGKQHGYWIITEKKRKNRRRAI